MDGKMLDNTFTTPLLKEWNEGIEATTRNPQTTPDDCPYSWADDVAEQAKRIAWLGGMHKVKSILLLAQLLDQQAMPDEPCTGDEPNQAQIEKQREFALCVIEKEK